MSKKRILERCARLLSRNGTIGRFGNERSGNVATIFGLSLVPLMGFVGAAVDYSSAVSLRSKMQIALDGAVLANSRQLSRSDAEIERAIRQALDTNLPAELQGQPFTFELRENRSTLFVSMQGTYATKVMRVLGFDAIGIGASAEATSAVDNAEVVLALDTTGTMRNHIPALRQAASDLVRILMREGPQDNVRVALVPYVTAVNVGNHPNRMQWMDVYANARHHGENFRNVAIGDSRCDPPKPPSEPTPPKISEPKPPSSPTPTPPPSEPKPPTPRSPDLGMNGLEGPTFASVGGTLSEGVRWLLDAVTPGAAQAAGVYWPYGVLTESTPMDCNRRTPSRVNHFDLFNAMGVSWKGCVEARPSPFDVTDTPPNPSNPDTLFVPYLWPDESDNKNHDIRNNYLLDRHNMPSWVKQTDALRQAWLWKYHDSAKPSVDNTSFITRGPNAACPDPIVPLTANRMVLDNAISSLRAYGASGTNIAEGLAWAWRMLSPNAPFPEAVPYGPRNKKYIVLMTDGFNEVVPQGVNWNRSDYAGTGYAAKARFGSQNLATVTTELDKRLVSVCNNVKDSREEKNIVIFTVLYDPVGYTSSSQVEKLLRDCASGPRNAYKAASREDLISAFNAIGNEISALRISR